MKRKLIIFVTGLLVAGSIEAQKINIGTYTFKDGSVFTGNIVGGKPSGKGRTVFKSGDTYEGEYVKGKRQGYGIYSFTDSGIKAEFEYLIPFSIK